jgi:APA family basic amino acid/polyamine antiporter
MAWIVCPLAVLGCALLFVNLSWVAKSVFVLWAVIGLVFYMLYGKRRSHLAPGNEHLEDTIPVDIK